MQARNRAIGRGQDACVGQILADEEFKPKTGSAQIKRVFSPNTEGIAVTTSPEGYGPHHPSAHKRTGRLGRQDP